MNPVELSIALLKNVRDQKRVQSWLLQMAQIPVENIINLADNQKLAFWINIYNSHYQLLQPQFTSGDKKIFLAPQISLADTMLSLDDIEHGILRKMQFKYGFGFIRNFCSRSIIKRLAVEKLDYKIHFALNCGAESCPAIRFYEEDKVFSLLEMAQQSFLSQETLIHRDKKQLHVSRIFLWFFRDFQNISTIRDLHSKVLEEDFSGYSIKFRKFNHKAKMGNFHTVSARKTQ